jgi:hypothetical protein
MQNNRKRALRVTLLVAFIAAIPLSYFAYLSFTTPALEVKNLGVVPQFSLHFSNNPIGMTHFDTERHPTVIAIVRDLCETGCESFARKMVDLEHWVEKHIKQDLPNVKDPSKIRLIAMGEGPEFLRQMPAGWDLATAGDQQPYLIPPSFTDDKSPAFVVIDDSSFFRAYLPEQEDRLMDNLKVLITRITSHQYLMHYVAQQALMWQKARGRMRQESATQ